MRGETSRGWARGLWSGSTAGGGVWRARQPEVFAIATERLAWQRGQHLFMLFGALAGAREVVVVDSHGDVVRRTRGELLAHTPVRLGQETISGAADFA